METDFRAAAVVHLAELFELTLRHAAREAHAVELAAACDFDFKIVGQRIDHGDADAVQAARGLIDLGIEFATGMQRAHDDFERGFLGEFRVRIDRDAAAVVGDGQEAVSRQFDVDEGCVAGDGLVHRIVDHLGEQVVQRLLVGAADIHARTPAHRLQPLQHLDMAGVIAFAAVLGLGAALGSRLEDRVERPRGLARRGLVHAGEEIVAIVHRIPASHANHLTYCHGRTSH